MRNIHQSTASTYSFLVKPIDGLCIISAILISSTHRRCKLCRSGAPQKIIAQGFRRKSKNRAIFHQKSDIFTVLSIFLCIKKIYPSKIHKSERRCVFDFGLLKSYTIRHTNKALDSLLSRPGFYPLPYHPTALTRSTFALCKKGIIISAIRAYLI